MNSPLRPRSVNQDSPVHVSAAAESGPRAEPKSFRVPAFNGGGLAGIGGGSGGGGGGGGGGGSAFTFGGAPLAGGALSARRGSADDQKYAHK